MNNGARSDWIDSFRGVAILIVVCGHSVQLATMYTGHEFAGLAEFFDVARYLPLPALFFLSGLLVPRSLARAARSYVRAKAARILWPYVLWSAIVVLLGWFLSRSLGWYRVPSPWNVLMAPIEHLWFLAYVLIYYLLALVARTIHPAWCVLAAVLLTSVPISGTWSQLPYMAVPFFLGVTAGRHRATFDGVIGRVGLCATLFVTALGTFAALVFRRSEAVDSLGSLAMVLGLLVGFIGLINPVSDKTYLAPLRFIGENSLVIYLVHWPVMIALVPLLVTHGYADPSPLLGVCLASGTLSALTFVFLARRVPAARWLFEWRPRSPGSDVPPTTPTARDHVSL